jgi:hypothetical protein
MSIDRVNIAKELIAKHYAGGYERVNYVEEIDGWAIVNTRASTMERANQLCREVTTSLERHGYMVTADPPSLYSDGGEPRAALVFRVEIAGIKSL